MSEDLGAQIQVPDELLHRQIHPTWIVEGRPSSLAFIPSDKDESLLSVDRDSIANAEQSYTRHTASGLKSSGTWSFSVDECPLPIFAAAIDDNEAHCVVSFSGLISKSEVRKVGKRLKQFAGDRGATFLP